MNRTAHIQKIAQYYLHIETLKTRNSGRLNFKEVSVSSVVDAVYRDSLS
jgi:hypothetical protein